MMKSGCRTILGSGWHLRGVSGSGWWLLVAVGVFPDGVFQRISD